MTARSYAQPSTPSSGSKPTDSIGQTALEYAQDNLRFAVGVKAQRAAKLLLEENLDKIEENKRLDSVNKSLKRQIEIKEGRLQADDLFVTTQNNTIWEQGNTITALRKQLSNLSRDERRGRKKFSVNLAGGIGYDVLTGRRAITVGIYSGPIIARY